MSRVNTVLGPVPAEELRVVAVHEHIGYGMPGSELDTKWWKTPEQRYEETVPKLRRFHEYGGGTFVDATGICNGRDIDYYKSLSAKTGVHIVACTGPSTCARAGRSPSSPSRWAPSTPRPTASTRHRSR
ncbi:hypothetical protein ABTZ21_36970 [Streptomyces sp. NPDC096191]|uniref:phosphotriesterase family protein n=1 Tax=Streptomyces sp. NPDC096191 TaxID=3155426 RepID=UPI00331E1A4A